jgi:hypothetical protein
MNLVLDQVESSTPLPTLHVSGYLMMHHAMCECMYIQTICHHMSCQSTWQASLAFVFFDNGSDSLLEDNLFQRITFEKGTRF